MGPGTDVEDKGLLEPGDEEVGPFTDGFIDHTTEPVKENGSLSSVYSVKRGV